MLADGGNSGIGITGGKYWLYFPPFPLKVIASYLKVMPETLSRVRNAIANGSVS
jgi:hypothetical protein